MKNLNVYLAFLVSLSIIALSVCASFAMTVHSVERAQRTQPAIGIDQVETVYLLSWTDSQLRTTQGTFSTNEITIINNSGLARDKIALQENPLVVQFIKEMDKLIGVVILSNTK